VWPLRYGNPQSEHRTQPSDLQYLSIACATILFYEYFLTFSDEVGLDRIVIGLPKSTDIRLIVAIRVGREEDLGYVLRAVLPRDHPNLSHD
jgi:hypothetical protein